MAARTSTPPLLYSGLLILTATIGLWASIRLLIDKITIAENPDAVLGCDHSLLVQCSANLMSGQGAVFGFPNPVLGVTGFVAPIAVGVGLLAGAQFARWFWVLFNVGVAAGFVFVLWLAGQSIYSLGTLCPYCMVVWAVTIPLFWVVTLRNAAAGHLGNAARGWGRTLLPWAIPLSLGVYIVIAALAQIELDVIGSL